MTTDVTFVGFLCDLPVAVGRTLPEVEIGMKRWNAEKKVIKKYEGNAIYETALRHGGWSQLTFAAIESSNEIK